MAKIVWGKMQNLMVGVVIVLMIYIGLFSAGLDPIGIMEDADTPDIEAPSMSGLGSRPEEEMFTVNETTVTVGFVLPEANIPEATFVFPDFLDWGENLETEFNELSNDMDEYYENIMFGDGVMNYGGLRDFENKYYDFHEEWDVHYDVMESYIRDEVDSIWGWDEPDWWPDEWEWTIVRDDDDIHYMEYDNDSENMDLDDSDDDTDDVDDGYEFTLWEEYTLWEEQNITYEMPFFELDFNLDLLTDGLPDYEQLDIVSHFEEFEGITEDYWQLIFLMPVTFVFSMIILFGVLSMFDISI